MPTAPAEKHHSKRLVGKRLAGNRTANDDSYSSSSDSEIEDDRRHVLKRKTAQGGALQISKKSRTWSPSKSPVVLGSMSQSAIDTIASNDGFRGTDPAFIKNDRRARSPSRSSDGTKAPKRRPLMKVVPDYNRLGRSRPGTISIPPSVQSLPGSAVSTPKVSRLHSEATRSNRFGQVITDTPAGSECSVMVISSKNTSRNTSPVWCDADVTGNSLVVGFSYNDQSRTRNTCTNANYIQSKRSPSSRRRRISKSRSGSRSYSKSKRSPIRRRRTSHTRSRSHSLRKRKRKRRGGASPTYHRSTTVPSPRRARSRNRSRNVPRGPTSCRSMSSESVRHHGRRRRSRSRSNSSVRSRYRPSKRSDDPYEWSSVVHQNKVTSPTASTSRSGVICLNCGQYGHTSKECTNPHLDDLNRAANSRAGPVCFRCGKPGHFAKDCVSEFVNPPNLMPPDRNGRGCYNCGQHGHIAVYCPYPKSKKQETHEFRNNPNNIPISRNERRVQRIIPWDKRSDGQKDSIVVNCQPCRTWSSDRNRKKYNFLDRSENDSYSYRKRNKYSSPSGNKAQTKSEKSKILEQDRRNKVREDDGVIIIEDGAGKRSPKNIPMDLSYDICDRTRDKLDYTTRKDTSCSPNDNYKKGKKNGDSMVHRERDQGASNHENVIDDRIKDNTTKRRPPRVRERRSRTDRDRDGILADSTSSCSSSSSDDRYDRKTKTLSPHRSSLRSPHSSSSSAADPRRSGTRAVGSPQSSTGSVDSANRQKTKKLDPNRKKWELHVANLPEGAHPKEIKDWCADLLVGFELTANRNPILFVTPPQRNENYCFIEFCNEVTMLAALELNGATLRNKPVRFDMTRGYKKKFLEEHRQRKAKEAEDEEVKKQKHAAVMAEISSSVAHLSTLQTPAPQLILMAEDSSIDECVKTVTLEMKKYGKLLSCFGLHAAGHHGVVIQFAKADALAMAVKTSTYTMSPVNEVELSRLVLLSQSQKCNEDLLKDGPII